MENAINKNKNRIILVPVDYSNYSIIASRYAAKIANKSGGNICFFHTFLSPAFDLIELTGGLHSQQEIRTDITKQLITSEEKDMNEFINKLYKYKEFTNINRSRILKELRAGLAKDEIIHFSEDINPEIVVMGTQGTNKKSNSILGSITAHAIKKLKVPIIAIPEDYKFIGKENLQKTVYLTDFDESDFMSIKKLMRFSDLFNMSIHCVHIGSNKNKWELLKMEGLKHYFHNIYKKDSVECHLLINKPNLLHAIDKYVQENKVNIIALTHKKRKLINKIFKPSIAKKIFYHTEVPLLVFHS